MSKKQRLESLASLGMLRSEDVKHPNPVANAAMRRHWHNMALLGWVTIAMCEAIVIALVVAFIWYKKLTIGF